MNSYQVGGSLDQDDPYYVKRKSDIALFHSLQAGKFCYVFNSRQMGKSSLMVRSLHQLQQTGVACAAIDLSRLGSETTTLEQWYKGLAVELWQAFDLLPQVSLKTWWQDHEDLSPLHRLSRWVEEILLVEITTNLVIFLDEVDCLRTLNFSSNDFFAWIRSCYNQRSLNPAYHRLTFALFGVTTPSDLITDPQRTPFNIGQAIALEGFQLEEAQPLIQGLATPNPELTLQKILVWTNGQPFLTQKLCQLVQEFPERSVDAIVETSILSSWEYQDEPEHLRTIRDRILYDPVRSARLLDLYRQVLDHPVSFSGDRDQLELLLSGIVVNQQGQLKVKNVLYRKVFTPEWVDHQLANLRPYAPALTGWLQSDRQDNRWLLQGEILQETLAWALGKSLSDTDYQFLGASQELAKQQVQSALEVVEQANRMLANARQQAAESIPNQRIRRRWMLPIGLIVSFAIALFRWTGFLQPLELATFDQTMRFRPVEATDSRIVLINIDETDITQVGYPIPDGVLANAIARIQAQKPDAIGLNIYRDLPVEPGHQDLLKVFQTTANLFGIEKVVGTLVAPPSVLEQRDQVGFSDFIEDEDGTVRRVLLSVRPKDQVRYSLATKLALHYLNRRGITPNPLDQSQLQLGQAIFQRFEQNDGAYVRAVTGGYQLLLNFRNASFQRFSLQQVLKGQIPPDRLRDRIILIGYVADSVNDFFRVATSERISGIALHATLVSQILSAALDRRPLIRVWSDWVEIVWIVLGSGLAAVVSGLFRAWWSWAIAMGCLSAGLILGCYGALVQGWWLPMVPAFLGIWGTAIALLFLTYRQRDRLRFQHTAYVLLAQRQQYPTAAQIALEYLKLSETKDNQRWIEKRLQGK
jgi:adenylate cyclase